MYPNDSSIWQYKIYADIRRSSMERGHQTTAGQSKTSIFSAFGSYIFGTVGNKANILYSSIILSLVAFAQPQTPKYVTLNDLEWPFYVSVFTARCTEC